jgi:hypothetical protein
MSKSNIHYLLDVKQDAKEGIFTMRGISLTKLIHSLIREHGSYYDGTYSIEPDSLPLHDKKLILSHITDSEEQERAFSCPTRTEALLYENISHIRSLFDDECTEVYQEDMEEMGLTQKHFYDNNETYWVRR